MVPEERRRQIARLVREKGSVTVRALEDGFGISPMTARRDLVALEGEGRVQRTHGGAVLPEYAGHEDSFAFRMEQAVEEKERLAAVAVGLLEPGASVFLDCSTTTYFLARRILRDAVRVTLLTNSIPVMEMFSTSAGARAEVVGVGGVMRRLTRSFVGPHAVATVAAYAADRAFISVKGLSSDGYMTDPDVLEAEVKRAMIEHSREPVLLADGSKLQRRGLSVVAHASALSQVFLDGAPAERVRGLIASGVRVQGA